MYFSNVKKQPKGGKKHKGGEESNADWEDSDDQDEFSELDDEVVSLGSMEEDFGEDVDEEGGAFMDVTGDEGRLTAITRIELEQDGRVSAFMSCAWIR